MSEPAEKSPATGSNMPVDETPAVLLASASWVGADGYEVGGQFHERATSFFAAVKWDVLVSLSSSFRNGISCEIGEKFSIGHFNMVRQIVFADGVRWVARVRLPKMEAVFGERELLEDANILRVEVASMKFLKTKTSIPVPEVHHYDVGPNNAIGASYILMDYIDGTVATDLQEAKGFRPSQYGTPDQDRKFRQQMAAIQVELSCFVFHKIGSLYYDEPTSRFFIGPEVETGKGPWKSPMEYYADLADHALESCVASAGADVLEAPSFGLPILFKHLISLYGQGTNRSGLSFRLTNRDFGAHNLLVNDNFEIVGVIDFDGVMAAPAEVVAQYPQLTGFDPQPPGHIETRQIVLDRLKIVMPQIEQYKNLIGTIEATKGSYKTRYPTISSSISSEAASIYRGIHSYMSHQKFVNDKWMDAYTRLLLKNVKPREPSAP
ncbi:MAG: hypothetical protein M4579_000868 [Chaenotheca gracillima]|nr:MAG: hypothetical protein M4579_000868 [Chaenotheca gracillima]